MRPVFFLLMSMLFLLTSCDDRKVEGEVLLSSNPVLVSRGQHILEYDRNSCQLSFNRERCEFGVFKDNLSDFFTVTLSGIPSMEGEVFEGRIMWSSIDNIEEHKNVSFKVLKLEADTVWLKAEVERILLVLKILV